MPAGCGAGLAGEEPLHQAAAAHHRAAGAVPRLGGQAAPPEPEAAAGRPHHPDPRAGLAPAQALSGYSQEDHHGPGRRQETLRKEGVQETED